MTIKGLIPFIKKRYTPREVILREINGFENVYVDVYSLEYSFLMGSPSAEALKTHLLKKYEVGFGKIIFVFDGQLHEAKKETRKMRIAARMKKFEKKVMKFTNYRRKKLERR